MIAEPLIIGINGYVSCIDPATGAELWRTKLMSGLLGGSVCQDVSVLIRGQFVFAGTWGNLFCLDLNSGAILWKNELKGTGYNDVSLAMEGVSVQFLTKVQHSSSTPSST